MPISLRGISEEQAQEIDRILQRSSEVQEEFDANGHLTNAAMRAYAQSTRIEGVIWVPAAIHVEWCTQCSDRYTTALSRASSANW